MEMRENMWSPSPLYVVGRGARARTHTHTHCEVSALLPTNYSVTYSHMCIDFFLKIKNTDRWRMCVFSWELAAVWQRNEGFPLLLNTTMTTTIDAFNQSCGMQHATQVVLFLSFKKSQGSWFLQQKRSIILIVVLFMFTLHNIFIYIGVTVWWYTSIISTFLWLNALHIYKAWW